MTAIITKQNAKDKAFIGGGGGGGSDYPTDATFDTIKVNKEATFIVNDKDITFANHESRIRTLEQSGGSSGDSAFTLTSGYPEIMITTNLTETDDVNTHTLTITIDNDVYKDYVGDMIEFTLPNEMIADLTTAGVTQSVKITKQANSFTCPVIEYKNTGTDESPNYKYTLTNSPNQTSLFIRMISALDYPLSLFTSGNMQIKSIVQQPTLNTTNNIKCNLIEADNTLTLYRSPLPNLYEMIDLGESGDYWYAYWGYDVGTPEFNSLIDGQEFHFVDNAFGTSYTLRKLSDKWEGDHVCYNTDAKIECYNVTGNDLNYGWIFLEMSDYNKFLLSLCGWSEGQNPFELAYNAGFITSNYDIEKIQYGTKDNKWYMKFTEKGWDSEIDWRAEDEPPQPNFEINFKIAYGDKSTAIHKLKINIEWSDSWGWFPETNLIANLELDCVGDNHYPSIEHNNGLMIFMHKDYIYTTTSDIKYQSGTNPFEYLRTTDYYNVEPRPEACSTLYTTHNICTTGNIIGQNIESHVFALNSLGNDVDRAVVRLSQLTQYVEQMIAQIEAQISALNSSMELMQFGELVGGIFSVLGSISSIVATGAEFATKTLTSDTLAVNGLIEAGEMELEDIAATGMAEFAELSATGTASLTNVTIVGETEVTNLVATGTAEFNNITATGIATIEDITITSLTTEGEASINK